MSPRQTWVLLCALPSLSIAALGVSPARAAAASANVALVPRLAGATTLLLQQTGTGSIRGRIVDEGGAPAIAVQVIVVGTQQGAMTGGNGEYMIRGVRPGSVTVRAARIGYTPQTRTVTVAAGGEAVADFTLQRVAARLEEVVTTATGEQSRRQFGNVVATVNADSITARAPITNVHEVLQARTAGVQVIQGWGQTGSSPSIRIRGQSSLSLTNEPLVIVDGIRFDNSAHQSNISGFSRINRLGTLNPEEIESIDIIKGPSAAALYGTAAANGVLVIRTKRGQPGRARWTAYGEAGRVDNPQHVWKRFPNYWSFGQNLNAQGQRTGSPNIQCKIVQAAASSCVIDSSTVYNPWLAPETDPFQSQPRYMGGLQVSGGTEILRYFLSAERETETGPYTMPQYEIDRITRERGVPPREREINPNYLAQNSARGNFQLGIRPNLTLDVNSGYVQRDLWQAFEGTYFAGMTFQFIKGPGYKNTVNGLEREFVGDVFGVENRIRDQRFTGSMALNYQPLTWLSTRAVAGLDQAASYGYLQQLRGEGTRVGIAWGPTGQEGGKDFDRTANSRYTVDLGATATWNATPELSTRTSVGAQWFLSTVYQGQGRGWGLPPGSSTPNAARTRLSWEFTAEEAQYGAFLEEQVGWRERLFVTLGGRTDQTSSFGREAGATFYPRAAVSYVISEEPWFPELPAVGRLRLRLATGQAGVQPSTIAALQFLGAAAYPTGAAADEPGLRLAAIGNQNLRPEVTTEVEGGFDLGLVRERVNVEATMFRKISRDALFQRNLPPSYGTSIGSAAPTRWENLARVENRGVELTVDAQILRGNTVSWNMRVNGSHLKNKLVSAGNVPLPTTPGIRNEVGYPLFGLWDREITGWNDANNDGILTDAEITVSDGLRFRGSTLPEYEAGLSNTIGLFRDQLTLTAVMDYRGGFWKYWRTEEWRCQSSVNCRGVNDRTAPLDEQAAAVGVNSSTKRTAWGYFRKDDFIKFREFSASYNVPERFAQRFLRARTTSLTLSARNLGYLWKEYPGIDPESNDVVSNTGGGNRELTAQPPLRYYIIRANVAF